MTQLNGPTELVIVRRRNPLFSEAPKGGVWKIAYADFMTAMMAFFLVMWLINVTDDSVKKGVAQYFNPVNLAATSPNRKGLNDPNDDGVTNDAGQDRPIGDGGTEGKEDGSAEAQPTGSGSSARKPSGEYVQTYTEAALFADPYAVLDKLSHSVPGPAAEGEAPEKVGFGVRTEKGAKGGEAYRDPFDPLYWQFTPQGQAGDEGEPVTARKVALGDDNDVSISRMAAEAKPTPKPDIAKREVAETVETERSTSQAAASGDKSTLPARQAPSIATANVTGTGEGATVASKVASGEKPATTAAASSTEERLKAELAKISDGPLGAVAARVSVEHSDDGLLISLTDASDFGMFAVGSAEPRPQLVQLMKRIGETLAAAKGEVVIRGHTDARPFHSGTYDNWRLSTARAHIAHYMLMRGGLDAGRIERVEGYADRHLKVPSDPYAPSNRRIEILLKEHKA